MKSPNCYGGFTDGFHLSRNQRAKPFVGFIIGNNDGGIEMVFGHAEYLREKARQFRQAARRQKELSRHLLALAEEFEARAAEIEAGQGIGGAPN